MKVLVSMLRLIFVAVVVGAVSFTSHGNTTIRLGLNNWCPHVCVPSGFEFEKGYTSDILIAILTDAGYQIDTISAPFMRLLNMAKNGEIDIIGSIYPEEAPFLMFSTQSTGIAEEAFFVNLESQWQYFNIGSLEEDIRVGLIKGAAYSNDEFHQYIVNHPDKFNVVSGVDIVPRQLRMLLARRFDTFVGDRFVVQYFANKVGVSDKVKNAGELSRQNMLYAGVTPAHPEAEFLISIIDIGIIRLRASGELAKIMAKYGLEDWK